MRTSQDKLGLEALVLSMTEATAPALCPEIRLQLKPSSDSFDSFRSRLPARCGGAPPYWCVAWPGGQALARYLIDNRSVSGLRVVDLGTGSGLAAIAAMMGGASSVRAVDSDPLALVAARVNCLLNRVTVDTTWGELATTGLEGVHVVLAGDLWYEPLVAREATAALRRLAGQSIVVIAADPRRSYFPRSRRELLATYEMAASEELEQARLVTADVWRLLP